MEDLVSVITPAYNAEKYISQTINSVINQIYDNWEMVIVNDGSTDRTEQIIKGYVEKYPDKIFLYSNEKNSGAAVALNEAMKHAKGKYMCWLSADDAYVETMLSSSVQFLQEHKEYNAVFSKYANIDENNKLISLGYSEDYVTQIKEMGNLQPYHRILKYGNAFHGCALFAEREIFQKTGEFDPNFMYAVDYEYWFRMASVANIGFLDEFNVLGRIHPGQDSNKGKNEIYAIRAFCHNIRKKEIIQPLLEKINEEYSIQNIKECFLNRIIIYKDFDEELIEILDGMSNFLKEYKEVKDE